MTHFDLLQAMGTSVLHQADLEDLVEEGNTP